LQSDVVKVWYFRLRICDQTKFKAYNIKGLRHWFARYRNKKIRVCDKEFLQTLYLSSSELQAIYYFFSILWKLRTIVHRLVYRTVYIPGYLHSSGSPRIHGRNLDPGSEPCSGTQEHRGYLIRISLNICQNGWTDQAQILCWASHDPREGLWILRITQSFLRKISIFIYTPTEYTVLSRKFWNRTF